MIALRTWLIIALAVVVTTTSTGCFRNGFWKKKEAPLPGSDSTMKLPEPNVKAQMPRDLPTPIASPVQPPIADSQAGAAPLMPGMPGSPSAPINTPKPPPGVPSSVPDSPLPPTALNMHGEAQLVSADAPDGPLRRRHREHTRTARSAKMCRHYHLRRKLSSRRNRLLHQQNLRPFLLDCKSRNPFLQ